MIIVLFVLAVYLFETSEKDSNITANEPPPGVIGR